MTVSKPENQSSNIGTSGIGTKKTSAPASTSDRSQQKLPFVAPQLIAVSDFQDSSLATPINSSPFTLTFINQLPAYRQGLSSFQRGLQVGIAHGSWLPIPFVALGPLRDTHLALLAGALSAAGVVVIATLALLAYAESAPPQPIATLTTPNPPDNFKTSQGWQSFAQGFLMGGMGGIVFAFVLLMVFNLIQWVL